MNQTNKEIENSQKDIKSGYLGEEGDDVLVYTTNQTKNTIKEEFEKEFGYVDEDHKWWLSKIDELLKSQEHKLIEEWYTKGFKDGFSYSAEGFNGEYTHPDVNLENDLYEQIGSNLSNLIKNN